MKKFIAISILILSVGFFLPEKRYIPVQGATASDWHPQSFWYYPWGKSITHKGIDIFAAQGTPIIASSSGFIWRVNTNSIGGNNVIVLGAKWRFHYYAHLQQIDVLAGRWIKAGQRIGTVGNTGNAQGKPFHLHYSIVSPIPLLWQWDNQSPQGYLKIFFINPQKYLIPSI